MPKLTLFTILANLVILTITEPTPEELKAIAFLKATNNKYLKEIQSLKNYVHETRYVQNFNVGSKKHEILYESYPDPKQLDTFRYEKFENEDIKRQLQILSRKDLFALGNNTSIIDLLRSSYNEIIDCLGKSPDKCINAPLSDLLYSVYQIVDGDKTIFYWKRGKSAGKGVRTIDKLQKFAKIFQKIAKDFYGYKNLEDMWYSDYEEENFSAFLEDLIVQLRPFYVQLHAYVRHRLQKKYGNFMKDEATIPQHLMNEVIFRVMGKIIDKDFFPYPADNLRCLDETMRSLGYRFINTTNMANEYLETMGIPQITNDFFKTHTKLFRPGKRKCSNEYYDFDSDLLYKLCALSSFDGLLRSHYYMTLMQYSWIRSKLPVGLNREACPGFAKGLAEAIRLSALNSDYLAKLGFLPDCTFQKHLKLNILFSMSVELLFPLVENFVHEKLWLRIVSGKIEPDQYNCEYWSLMKDYAGIEPPQHRTELHFDVNHSFYDILEERPVAKILSKVLGFHIYRSLCNTTGSDNSESCSFHGNRKIGEKLSKIMSMGSRQSWRSILKILSGSKIIDASSILDYFQPLSEWLTRKNAEEKYAQGWNSTLKCDYVSRYFEEYFFEE